MSRGRHVAKGGALLAAALALLAALPALAADTKPDFDLWPFVYVARDPEKGERVVEVLGPLFEVRNSDTDKSLFVRPFYNRITDKLKPETQEEMPWPFGFSRLSPLYDAIWFFPLVQYDAEKTAAGEKEKARFFLLPFIWYRYKGEDKTSDRMFWPFWGLFHNWYDRDTVRVVAWPFYIYQASDEAESWDTPWPFIGTVKWRNGGRGFKFWPFYGRNVSEGRMDKRFVLWPFYNYVWAKNRDGLEFKEYMFWPFYGEIIEPMGYEEAWVWPFFRHRIDRTPSYGDFSGGVEPYEVWHYPWPFLARYKGVNGSDVRGYRFWPIYSWAHWGPREITEILWPIIWRFKVTPKESPLHYKMDGLWVVPFYYHQTESENGKSNSAFQIWPFYRNLKNDDGSEEWETLSLWPGKRKWGWERNWAPWFRLYYAQRTPDGRATHRLLGRFLRVDSAPGESFFELKPIIRIDRRSDESPRGASTEWSFLSGLLGREQDDGKDKLRFLWLFKVSLGEARR